MYFVVYLSMYLCDFVFFFFFKQKTAYEMRISDWSSDVCSSDLQNRHRASAHSIPPHARSRSRRWETPRHSHPSDSVAQPTRQARCQWPARRVAPSAGPRKSGISMVAAVERTASWMVPTPPQEAPSPPHSTG